MAVFEFDDGGFVAEVGEVLGGFEDGFADDGERAAAADVAEIGREAAALAADGVAVGAAGLGVPEDVLAGGGVAGDGVGGGGAGEGVDEGDEVPGLFVGEFGGRHVGAGDAFADDLEDGVIGEGVPEGAADEIGTAGAAAAVGAVAAGAGAHEELGAGGDGFGVADGGVVGIAEIAAVLGEEGEGEEGEGERAHRPFSLCQVDWLAFGEADGGGAAEGDDIERGAGADEEVGFGGLHLLLFNEPAEHVGEGDIEGLVERSVGLGADGDDVVLGFGAGAGEAGLLAKADGDGDVEGGFDAGADGFAVALQGVAIAEEEQATGVEDGEENGCAGADPVVVDIAAPVAGGAGAGGVIALGGDADAAEHGAVGEREFWVGIFGAGGVGFEIDDPGDEVVVAFDDGVGIGRGGLEIFGEIFDADGAAGVAGGAVGREFVDADEEGVAGFGAFDVEGAGERVAVGFGAADELVVEAGGVYGFGGDGVARLDEEEDGVGGGEGVVVGFGDDLVGGGEGGEGGEEEEQAHW